MCHVLGVDLAHFVGYLLSWDLGLQQCFLPEHSEENKGATCGVHQRQILGAPNEGLGVQHGREESLPRSDSMPQRGPRKEGQVPSSVLP